MNSTICGPVRRRRLIVVVDETYRCSKVFHQSPDIRVISMHKSLPLDASGNVAACSGHHARLSRARHGSSGSQFLAMWIFRRVSNSCRWRPDSLRPLRRLSTCRILLTQLAPVSEEGCSLSHRLETNLMTTTREVNSDLLVENHGQSGRL